MRLRSMKKKLALTYDVLKNDFCRRFTFLLIIFIAFTECAFANSAYVTNFNSGTVSVIDTQTNTVIATVSLGTNPAVVAITPDGSQAYVSDNGSSTVSVIDTQTNAVIATMSVGINPSFFAITPNGTQAYVAN